MAFLTNIKNTDDRLRIAKVLAMMALLCGTVALAGINRLWGAAFLRAPVLDALRTCDVLVIFIFAPLSIIILWTLFKIYDGPSSIVCAFLFLMGVYMFGLGFGMHEPFNIFVSKYGSHMSESMRYSALYFDNDLGHWTFFAGFMLLSISGAHAEMRKPYVENLPFKVIACAALFGAITAVTIFFNMAKEKTGSDLMCLALTVSIVAVIHFIYSSKSLMRLPVVLALYIAFGGGTALTLFYWAAFGYGAGR